MNELLVPKISERTDELFFEVQVNELLRTVLDGVVEINNDAAREHPDA